MAIVAILAAGDNVEDSVIVNRASVERGLFLSEKRRVKTVSARHREDTSEITERFELPSRELVGRHSGSSYSKIETDGFPAIGASMNASDICIGSTLTTLQYDPASGDHVPKKQDTSFPLRRDEAPRTYDTRVSQILRVDNVDRRLYRICLDQLRYLREGDKVASRHGQKVRRASIFNRRSLLTCHIRRDWSDSCVNNKTCHFAPRMVWYLTLSSIHMASPAA